MASQKSPWIVSLVVLLFHSTPIAMSIEVRTQVPTPSLIQLSSVCASADWTGWVGLNPIPSYNPIVNNIDQLLSIVSSVTGQAYAADWTGWVGLNPIPSYNPIVNNIDQLFSIVSGVLGQTYAADWTGWVGINPIPSYNPIVNNIDQLFVLACQAAATTTTTTTQIAPSAIGDPHLQNMYGERFDLGRQGKALLIQIPRGELVEHALLVVEADVRHFGGHCADIYFQTLNITGAWTDKAGGFTFSARGASDEMPKWKKFGPLQLKVVRGRTNEGIAYLNFFVRRLGHAGFAVGGLLGEDDHTEAATLEKACLRTISLMELAGLSGPAFAATASSAIASSA